MTTSAPLIQLVVAYADNRVIGRDNTLPWRLPADLAHFKRRTLGHPIIMGRNTWESLGRALPGRLNVVVTRNPDYTAQGASVCGSLEQALALCADAHAELASIIGGEQIFRQALDIADRIVATEIHAEVDGDTWFPPLDAQVWKEVERQAQAPENGLAFDFVEYARQGK